MVIGMATLKDVAAKAGVSLSTAGAAMRGEDIVKPATKEKVYAAAKELGYSANLSARFLKKGSTGAIAVMVPKIDHPYYTNLVSALCDEIEKHNYRAIVQQTGYNSTSETNVLQQINSTLCDGLILNVNNVDDEHLRTMLGNHPTVLLNYQADKPLFDNIAPGNIEGLALAFGYLRGRGYRHVCIVGARSFNPNYQEDLSGQDSAIITALQLLASNGLGGAHDVMPCSWSIGGGIEAARALCAVGDGGDVGAGDADGAGAGDAAAQGERRIDQYDAFYCMNDLVAYGFIRGLHEQGIRVPEDKAVFGHDGIHGKDEFTIPTLSTVAVDYRDMATKAVNMLVDQLNHPGKHRKPRRETAGCNLVIGESA